MPTTKPGTRKDTKKDSRKKDSQAGDLSGSIFSFTAAEYAPTDLFTASSSLPQTDDATAETALRKIHEQGNSMKIALANLKLGELILHGEGQAIKNQILGTRNLILTQGLATEGVRLEQAFVQHEIETHKLEGMRIDASGHQQLLPLQREVWQARLEMLSVGVSEAKAAIEEKKNGLQKRYPSIKFEAPPTLPEGGGKKNDKK